ncbi:Nuclear control of ATPase protein 2 [Malassezia psittaci]|uniref:Nuclear control of ATPase protein 2 n=1 Tax=Malassezia psittaci TaxID=1821823 RepID=A0AAF0FEB5_9BASI|nr:Nuclear control of ATPase protein 2 [Malassezia psittaci]
MEAFPQRVSQSVVQCGLRPAYVSLAKVRQDAHTRVAKLGKQHDVLAAKLGNVALAWHSQKYTTCSLAVQVAGFLRGESGDASATKKTASKDAAKALLDALEQQESQLANMLSWSECGPPPFLARIWPLLVAYPLISMAVTHYVSSHWDSITTQIRQAGQTIRGLVVDWVWDPTMRMLDTLRAGRAERRLIISRDSLVADQESLERMVRSFGQDKLHLSGAELNESLARVRHGDLTGVMELYERDIRSPIRSMISGSLIRTVLIQVQKAKVDLEVALNGIDWLLHSQELLIGFVGLAPALGLVYVISRLLLRVLRAVIYGRSSVRAQQSQQAARLEAWDALRRIDALVHSDSHQTKSALHYGRLLLDIDCIRHAFQRLIAASTGNGAIAMHLTDEMHDDLSMLEVAGQDALLSTNENAWKHRRNTVDRLWRSWSWLLAMNRLTH